MTTRSLRAAVVALATVLAARLPSAAQPPDDGIPRHVPATLQRVGDPAAGYRALISGGWVGCGVPAVYYDLAMALVPDALEPEIATLPGRPPGQEKLPYFLNRFTTQTGLEVVAPNCLLCHAGRINGELVVGLGNADGWYQVFSPSAARVARILQVLSWLDPFSAARRAETGKVGDRLAAVAPYITVPIVGSNPTHNLAWALVAHRDAETLAWSNAPVMALPPVDAPPSDVPPWWRMAKKQAMFAAAGGQGDHTGFMAVNSTLCTDTVADFETFYDYFDDIRAYLASIQPPPYPFAIDPRLAEQGAAAFNEACAGCHGTYGEEERQYPDVLVKLDRIGTDPALALYNVETSAEASAWLNRSVFTRNGTYRPYRAYVAPPLDGIWATAPFLHNGSVPTLAALLDSRTRPTYWTRDFDDSTAYDPDAVGWRYETLPYGQAAANGNRDRRRIVDTTVTGFHNGGHTFGDRLTVEQRRAVLEYLKTL